MRFDKRLAMYIQAIGKMLTHPDKTLKTVYMNEVEYPERRKSVLEAMEKQEKVLESIGAYYDTDKASIFTPVGSIGIAAGHDYLRHYEMLFASMRNNEINVLEFGCQGGNSIKTWETYFPHAKVYGVDLNPKCKEFENERTNILIGNAVAQDTFNLLKERQYSIIIDDASHAWGEQRWALEHYWELLAEGGYYIVEDLECGALGAYAPEYIPSVIDATPFFEYALNIGRVLRWPAQDSRSNDKELTMQYAAEIQKIREELDMMVMIPGAMIFRKKV